MSSKPTLTDKQLQDIAEAIRNRLTDACHGRGENAAALDLLNGSKSAIRAAIVQEIIKVLSH